MLKRASALIMSLLVMIVIVILLGSYFLKVMTENNLVTRYVNSTRAFWLAEAGVAEAVINMPNNVSGNLGGSNYSYFAVTQPLAVPHFQIDSTGSVTLPGGGIINRHIMVIAETNPVDPNNFRHAIRTTSTLRIQGNVTLTAPVDPPFEEDAPLNFAALFEHTRDEVRAHATYLYTDPPVDVTPVAEITWIDVAPGGECRISSDTWSGSGILVVNGDCRISGGRFEGIIYVFGRLRMSGNPDIFGTILTESPAEIETTLTGTVEISHDEQAIIDALGWLAFIAPTIVSWEEI